MYQCVQFPGDKDKLKAVLLLIEKEKLQLTQQINLREKLAIQKVGDICQRRTIALQEKECRFCSFSYSVTQSYANSFKFHNKSPNTFALNV